MQHAIVVFLCVVGAAALVFVTVGPLLNRYASGPRRRRY